MLKIGLLAGLGAALVIGGAALSMVLRPLGPEPLPFSADKLPAGFASVSRTSRSMTSAETARAYSANAARCGGVDIVSIAHRADAFYAIEELATLVRDVERTSAYLRCGKNLVETTSTAYGLEIVTSEPEGRGRDSLLLLGIDRDALSLDGTFSLRSHGGFSALLCQTNTSASCAPGIGAGRIVGAPFWAFGLGATLDAYGASVAREEKLSSKDVEKIEYLASLVKPYAATTVGGPKGTFHFDVFSLFPLWSKDLERPRVEFGKRLTEAGAFWATGTPSEVEGEARLEILAERASGAREVLSALRDLRSALKHADLTEMPAYATIAETRGAITYAEIAKRAMSEADPVRDDDLVTWVVNLKALPEEARTLYEFDRDRERGQAPFTRLVLDLVDGRDPDEHTLRAIGGRELWLSVEQGIRNRAGRLAPPPTEQVPDLADVPVPGGGEIQDDVRGGSSLTPVWTRYRFEADRVEAVSIVNELKQLLIDAGWTVTLDSFESGPNYVCERDARRLAVRATYFGALEIGYMPLR